EVDKDEAAPSIDFDLRQFGIFLLEMLEIPLGGQTGQLALQIPGETMERAAQPLGVAALSAQGAAPVQAGIVEAADLAVLAARDDDGGIHDVIDHVVAGLRDFFFARNELPHFGPQLLRLEI